MAEFVVTVGGQAVRPDNIASLFLGCGDRRQGKRRGHSHVFFTPKPHLIKRLPYVFGDGGWRDSRISHVFATHVDNEERTAKAAATLHGNVTKPTPSATGDMPSPVH